MTKEIIKIYYCRKCGNFTYFQVKADYIYDVHLRGLVYSDIVPIKVKEKEITCKVCGSNDVGIIKFDDVTSVPELIGLINMKPEDRIKFFDNLKKEREEGEEIDL